LSGALSSVAALRKDWQAIETGLTARVESIETTAKDTEDDLFAVKTSLENLKEDIRADFTESEHRLESYKIALKAETL
jgi:hypothetical protein